MQACTFPALQFTPEFTCPTSSATSQLRAQALALLSSISIQILSTHARPFTLFSQPHSNSPVYSLLQHKRDRGGCLHSRSILTNCRYRLQGQLPAPSAAFPASSAFLMAEEAADKGRLLWHSSSTPLAGSSCAAQHTRQMLSLACVQVRCL